MKIEIFEIAESEAERESKPEGKSRGDEEDIRDDL